MKRKRQKGYLLAEAAIGIGIFMVVGFFAYQHVASSISELTWATRVALADTYLEKESSLMRRLQKAHLNTRGYNSAGDVKNNVALAYKLSGGTATPDIYLADSVTRRETYQNVGSYAGSYKYEVTLNFSYIGVNGTRSYSKTRSVLRKFE